MSKKNRLTIDHSVFEKYAEDLENLGGNLKATADKCLRESKELVDSQTHAAMKKHYRTGRTERSITDNAKVTWSGLIGEVHVGFDIANGGLPSIFLMYGTPKMAKDQKLYNAVYGTTTRRKIRELQNSIFEAEIRKLHGR